MKSVTLFNYQSHSNTHMEFLPVGVNAIGSEESNVGKSSILRAIEGVANNNLTASKRKRGTKTTSISVDNVKRVRTASKNFYTVGEEKYKAMGKSVPEAVSESINLTEINFRKQHEPYFLINESPGKVARAINEVADLTLIDKTVGALKTKASDTKKDLDVAVIGRKEAKKKLDDLVWWEKAEAVVAEYEAMLESVSAIGYKLEKLQDLASSVAIRLEVLHSYPAISCSGVSKMIADLGNYSQLEDLGALYTSIAVRWEDVDSYPEICYGAIDTVVEGFAGVSSIDSLQDLFLSIKGDTVHLDETANLAEDFDKVSIAWYELVENGTQLSWAIDLASSVGNIAIQKHPDFGAAEIEIDHTLSVVDNMANTDSRLLTMTMLMTSITSSSTEVSELDVKSKEAKDKFEDRLVELGHCPLCGGVK